MEVERVFDFGRVELSLFGEALVLAGDRRDWDLVPPPDAPLEAPLRFMTGIGLKF